MHTAQSPRFFSHICQRYARVLFDLPIEIRHALLKELMEFYTWAHGVSVRWKLITQPLLPPQTRNILLNLFQETHSMHPETKAFLGLLLYYERLHLLWDIVALTHNWIEEVDHTLLYFTSATPIPSTEEATLKKVWSQKLGRPICLRVQVDPSLLLGGIFVWKDFRIDASLAGILQRLYREIRYERQA